MTRKSEKSVAQAIVANANAVKPNIAEIVRLTGLSRNTAGKSFWNVWANKKMRFFLPDNSEINVERALVSAKLSSSDRGTIGATKRQLSHCPNVCEVLVVEGEHVDLLIGLVAKNHSEFSDSLFRIKEIETVHSANVAYRIIEDSKDSFSEYDVIED